MTDDTQSAMLLTEREWELLALICKQWRRRTSDALPETLNLANRIIEAAR